MKVLVKTPTTRVVSRPTGIRVFTLVYSTNLKTKKHEQ